MEIYQYDQQRVVSRIDGKIQSIKPMYNTDNDRYTEFFSLANKLKELSSEFPKNKYVVEMHNIPDGQYENIKSDIGIGEHFTDHASKFFFNVNVNAVIIAHKIY
jgi:hypothetical protein